jgi:hypothetical protein
MKKFVLPFIDMNVVFGIGMFVFFIQACCSVVLFFINLEFQNFFSSTIAWAGILFNFVLSYFFFYSRRSSKFSSSVVGDDVDMDVLLKGLKGDGK